MRYYAMRCYTTVIFLRRIWDCLMAEGSSVLFKVALAMITLQSSDLCRSVHGVSC